MHIRQSIALRVGVGLGAAVTMGSCSDDAADRVGTAPVSVQIDAHGCGGGVEHGGGTWFRDGLVLTAAHVIAGADRIDVTWNHATSRGSIAAFDPVDDLAVISVPSLSGAGLPVGSSEVGSTGVAAVIRSGESTTLPVRIVRQVNLKTTDIYGEATVMRPGFELQADVVAGDSGAGVIVDHELVAVIWARSTESPGRGWAIDPVLGFERISEQLVTGTIPDPIDPQRCVDDR